jgi:hypothetical protein
VVTLAEARRLALALPETTEEDHHGIPSFRVSADHRRVTDLVEEAGRRIAPKRLHPVAEDDLPRRRTR